ncbi:MAG: Asp-tRNA(Asn)/Glu-tRNA(Gln) amidotransferase subunit GatC [Gammaproteobacteria bacterium]
MDLDIERLAFLANLELDDAARQELTADLESILHMVDRLASAKLAPDTLPLRHPLDLQQPMRSDEAVASDQCDQRDPVLEHAPESKDGLFLVPQVIE